MSTKLIKVEKADGMSKLVESKNFRLNLLASLSEARKRLVSRDFMADGDSFLLNEAPIDRQDEAETMLSEVVGEDGKSTLRIGTVKADLGEDTDGSLQRYDGMLPEQKLALLSRVGAYQALNVTSGGIAMTSKPYLAPWHEETLPTSGILRVPTKVTSEYTFHEEIQHLMILGLDKASLSVNTPYGGGEAGFEHARGNTKDSRSVTEYLVGKVSVRTVKITVDLDNLQLMNSYQNAIIKALRKEDGDEPQAYNLIEKMNEIGYYVPRVFTLGGALHTSRKTEISEFSEAETEKMKFSFGVKVAFNGIGGGADYAHSDEHEESSKETNKYEGLTFEQIGGKRGTFNDYPAFLTSLESSINWAIISYDKLYPTLALLTDKRVRRRCIKLINKFATYQQIKELQPVLNLISYATETETAIDRL